MSLKQAVFGYQFDNSYELLNINKKNRKSLCMNDKTKNYFIVKTAAAVRN